MRTPPNSAALFKMRRAGRVPVPGPYGHVSILPAWDLETPGAFLLAPPDLDPLELDFSCVAGLEVAVFTELGDVAAPTTLWSLLLAVLSCDPAAINVIDLNRAAAGQGGLVAQFIRKAGQDA
jgi:hypothetical protein